MLQSRVSVRPDIPVVDPNQRFHGALLETSMKCQRYTGATNQAVLWSRSVDAMR